MFLGKQQEKKDIKQVIKQNHHKHGHKKAHMAKRANVLVRTPELFLRKEAENAADSSRSKKDEAATNELRESYQINESHDFTLINTEQITEMGKSPAVSNDLASRHNSNLTEMKMGHFPSISESIQSLPGPSSQKKQISNARISYDVPSPQLAESINLRTNSISSNLSREDVYKLQNQRMSLFVNNNNEKSEISSNTGTDMYYEREANMDDPMLVSMDKSGDSRQRAQTKIQPQSPLFKVGNRTRTQTIMIKRDQSRKNSEELKSPPSRRSLARSGGKQVYTDDTSSDRSSTTSSQDSYSEQDADSNDKESSILESSISSDNQQVETMHLGMYKKLTGQNNASYYQIKACWIQDNTKTVMVDINENDNVGYLLRKIGERLEETYEDFTGLRHCKAKFIYQEKKDEQKSNFKSVSNQATFNEEQTKCESIEKYQPHFLIKNVLRSGDQVFFEIDTIDIWINVQINISLRKKKILVGKAKFKFSKHATLGSLRRKLQIFGIRLWCHKNASHSYKDHGRSEKSQHDMYSDQMTTHDNYLPNVTIEDADAGQHSFEAHIEEFSNLQSAHGERLLKSQHDARNRQQAPEIDEDQDSDEDTDKQILMYALDKFSLSSAMPTKLDQNRRIYNTSVGVDGVVATHFLYNNPHHNTSIVSQPQIAPMRKDGSILNTDGSVEHILTAGSNQRTASPTAKNSTLNFNMHGLDHLDDGIMIDQLFDYQNKINVDMVLAPCLQLNFQSNIKSLRHADRISSMNDVNELIQNNLTLCPNRFKEKMADFMIQVQNSTQMSHMMELLKTNLTPDSSQEFKRISVDRSESNQIPQEQDIGTFSQQLKDINKQIMQPTRSTDFRIIQDDIYFKSEIQETDDTPFKLAKNRMTNLSGESDHISVSGKFGANMNSNPNNASGGESKPGEYTSRNYSRNSLLVTNQVSMQNSSISKPGLPQTPTVINFNDLAPSEANRVSGHSLKGTFGFTGPKYMRKESTNPFDDERELENYQKQFVGYLHQGFENMYLFYLKQLYRKFIKDILKCAIEKQVILPSQNQEIQCIFKTTIKQLLEAQELLKDNHMTLKNMIMRHNQQSPKEGAIENYFPMRRNSFLLAAEQQESNESNTRSKSAVFGEAKKSSNASPHTNHKNSQIPMSFGNSQYNLDSVKKLPKQSVRSKRMIPSSLGPDSNLGGITETYLETHEAVPQEIENFHQDTGSTPSHKVVKFTYNEENNTFGNYKLKRGMFSKKQSVSGLESLIPKDNSESKKKISLMNIFGSKKQSKKDRLAIGRKYSQVIDQMSPDFIKEENNNENSFDHHSEGRFNFKEDSKTSTNENRLTPKNKHELYKSSGFPEVSVNNSQESIKPDQLLQVVPTDMKVVSSESPIIQARKKSSNDNIRSPYRFLSKSGGREEITPKISVSLTMQSEINESLLQYFNAETIFEIIKIQSQIQILNPDLFFKKQDEIVHQEEQTQDVPMSPNHMYMDQNFLVGLSHFDNIVTKEEFYSLKQPHIKIINFTNSERINLYTHNKKMQKQNFHRLGLHAIDEILHPKMVRKKSKQKSFTSIFNTMADHSIKRLAQNSQLPFFGTVQQHVNGDQEENLDLESSRNDSFKSIDDSNHDRHKNKSMERAHKIGQFSSSFLENDRSGINFTDIHANYTKQANMIRRQKRKKQCLLGFCVFILVLIIALLVVAGQTGFFSGAQ